MDILKEKNFTPPKISVCIPAYNRADLLIPLLNSITEQKYPHLEIVVAEDNSPERSRIMEIMEGYQQNNKGLIKYFENQNTLGYDGNLRRLIELASGDYCLFMGNDDLLAPNALAVVSSLIGKYDNVGVILRSYAHFRDDPNRPTQEFRYFPREKFYPAGSETIATFFRRSVVISGLVLHRKESLNFSTKEFDGTLLYQLYLVGRLLSRMNGVYTPEIIAFYREGGIPDFGQSETEKSIFVPKEQTPESSLGFIRGMIRIAQNLSGNNKELFEKIMLDLGNYSYPLLSIQASRTKRVFIQYAYSLSKLGFWKYARFYFYFLTLIIFGRKLCDQGIRFIKRRIGHTPVIGNIFQGR